MNLYRPMAVLTAACFLIAASSPANAIVPIGVVTHAERAQIGVAALSAGTSVYDGDRLSTDSEGMLRLTSPELTLQLEAQSALIVRSAATPDAAVAAELASGTMVFSVATAGKLVVSGDGASICAARNTPTVAHVRVANRKELRVYAQRGDLEFSYRGETEIIPEGAAYRIVLDPSEKEMGDSQRDQPQKKPGALHYVKFLLLAVGVAAAIAIPILLNQSESPDKPGAFPSGASKH
jgi:hypothetical protein